MSADEAPSSSDDEGNDKYPNPNDDDGGLDDDESTDTVLLSIGSASGERSLASPSRDSTTARDCLPISVIDNDNHDDNHDGDDASGSTGLLTSSSLGSASRSSVSRPPRQVSGNMEPAAAQRRPPPPPDGSLEETPQSPVVINHSAAVSNQQRQVLDVIYLIAWSIYWTATATYTVLFGGKVGYAVSFTACELVGFVAIDAALSNNDNSSLPIPAALPTTVTPHSRNKQSIRNRGLRWLVIAGIQCIGRTFWYVLFDEKRAGTAAWQPGPLFFGFVSIFVCKIGLIGGLMFRAHLDRRPNALKFFVIGHSALALSDFGSCSPYPLASTLGDVLFLFTFTVGAYVLVIHTDKKAEHRDVRNGYALLIGLSMTGIQRLVLWISTLESIVGVFLVSGTQMLFQYVALEVTVPALKLCFGSDQRKRWMSAVPAMLLALELGCVETESQIEPG